MFFLYQKMKRKRGHWRGLKRSPKRILQELRQSWIRRRRIAPSIMNFPPEIICAIIAKLGFLEIIRCFVLNSFWHDSGKYVLRQLRDLELTISTRRLDEINELCPNLRAISIDFGESYRGLKALKNFDHLRKLKIKNLTQFHSIRVPPSITSIDLNIHPLRGGECPLPLFERCLGLNLRRLILRNKRAYCGECLVLYEKFSQLEVLKLIDFVGIGSIYKRIKKLPQLKKLVLVRPTTWPNPKILLAMRELRVLVLDGLDRETARQDFGKICQDRGIALICT
jgi:hypothetical protein